MNRLLRFLPLVALLGALALVASKLAPTRNPGAYDLVGFGKIPVLANGRIKPLDTVARSSLLQLQGRQRVSTPERAEPFVSTPTEWLLDVFYRPEASDRYPTFAIDHPELLALIGRSEDSLKIKYDGTAKQILALVGFIPGSYRRFAFNEIKPHLQAIEDQAKLAEQVEAGARSPFQRAVLQLYGNLHLYSSLKYAAVAPGRENFLGSLLRLQEKVPAGVAAVRAKQAGQPHDEALVTMMTDIGADFVTMSEASNFLLVPPEHPETNPSGWRTTGAALLETFESGHVDARALAFAGLGQAWSQHRPDQFNELVRLYRRELEKQFTPQLDKAAAEERFNSSEPFYTSMTLYALGFAAAIAALLLWSQEVSRAAYWIVVVAWLVATAGIVARMWLENRPPVTNLYSSALFVGWIAVAFCLALDTVFRNVVAILAGSAIGFVTLIIAHNLSLSGDTLEMMRAVLDSNFWLATHVVVVTAGYGATFLAGFLAIVYVVIGLSTNWLGREMTPIGASAPATAKRGETIGNMLTRMVYAIVCFATLFSFTGTVLGGIWADQSWGRFWGWDPKENGALIIVIWNALILHARWGGMIKARGLMCLAIFGNIVTGWSWFGTNMLGIGLHSYGFTDAAFWGLIVFAVSQVILILVANIPLAHWRSFRAAPGAKA